MARKRKIKTKICPPAKADGIKTTADVKPFRRRANQKPKKRIKYGHPRKNRRRRKTIKVSDVVITNDPLPSKLPVQPWTTRSRKIQNDNKERAAKRRSKLSNTKSRLHTVVKKLKRDEKKQRERRPRRRLRDLLNGGQSETQELPRKKKAKTAPRSRANAAKGQ